MPPHVGPPQAVLLQFGLRGTPARLPGGQGTTWQMGDVVLKPHVDPAYQEWLGTEVAAIRQLRFRLPSVVRAVDGSWVVGGWGAQSAVTGSPRAASAAGWHGVIDAGRALHDATAALARPAFLGHRTDPWAVADRQAWGELPRAVPPELSGVVDRLLPALGPLGADQVVHGDLTTNVLHLPGEPPAIIDFSPYWRPPGYAEGVVVADALCWHDASPSLLDDVDVPLAAVARGLLFRVLTAGLVHPRLSPALVDEARRWGDVLAALHL